MNTLLQIALGIGVILAVRKVSQLYQATLSINSLPGYRLLLSTSTFLSNVLPPIPGIVAGQNFLFMDKHSVFESLGSEIYSIISAWPHRITLCLADAAAIKEVTASRSRFPKPVWMYGTLSLFGSNILVTEGEMWKKHRKIAAPAFSEPNNKLVWNESLKVIDDLFNSLWANKDEISVSDCLLELTKPLTLFVIGAAAFGRRISWVEDSVMPLGHNMMFSEALHTVSIGVFMKLALPRVVMKMLPSLRKIDLAFDELRMYMKEMIQEGLTSEKENRNDLFSNLLKANNMDDGTLTDDEVMGNIFIFLLAGHETTANTLCFSLALLALYPEVQEELFTHIRSVIPDGTQPTYDHMPYLHYALAALYETLRMFPSVTGIPKESSQDTTLAIRNGGGEELVVPIPKGATFIISTPGLHYNPRYWKDPHEFKPSRFLGGWERDAFLPFSGGTRACLGRRFAELETVAVLCKIVTQFRIEVKEEPEFIGESFEAKKQRVLRTKNILTLTPARVPLTFHRRV